MFAMNMDATSTTSSSGQLVDHRKERGAIATQACDTCRLRKQKCDEVRPKCSSCQRMKLECIYKEPQPTKKDKTLADILDRVKSIDSKFDKIFTTFSTLPSGFSSLHNNQPFFGTDVEQSSAFSSNATASSFSQNQPGQQQQPSLGSIQSAAYKIVIWPAVQQMFLQSRILKSGDIKILEKEGLEFLASLEQGLAPLSLVEPLQLQPFLGVQSQVSRTSGRLNVTFPELTQEVMYRLATAYFDSFNFIYPFLDRQTFISDILVKIHKNGFGNDVESLLALLVFALGEVAMERSHGTPLEVHNGRPSGVRGGTAQDTPPGIGLFNEVRKRMGFIMTGSTLEHVQSLSLTALYYETCFRHLDFWRMSVFASVACQVLITSQPIDWTSSRGDLIRRIYWHCAIMETSMSLEFDVAPTGITSLEDRVGFPSFNASFCEQDYRGDQSSHYKAHFASLVALRRIYTIIYEVTTINTASQDTTTDSASTRYLGPTPTTLQSLAAHLSQWRSMLPREIQWADDDLAGFPSSQTTTRGTESFEQHNNSALPSHPRRELFTTDLDSDPIQYPYAFDIQVATFRTRYCYAKYMIYKPFVYKALHFPEQMDLEDIRGVSECLHACLIWPLVLSPVSRHKRLIPCLFAWSQNFLSILIIIHLTQQNEMLRSIRHQFCNERFEREIGPTIEAMIDWIRDLKRSDPVAQWTWNFVQYMYPTEDTS